MPLIFVCAHSLIRIFCMHCDSQYDTCKFQQKLLLLQELQQFSTYYQQYDPTNSSQKYYQYYKQINLITPAQPLTPNPNPLMIMDYISIKLYYKILNNKALMISHQLPSLQEIYDYSSSDLQKIVNQITNKLNTPKTTHEQQQKYQEYLENIKIELQQRKTLQFFQELCAVDNPYIKKVTDFNNQFLKLASQAIAAQQSTNPFLKKSLQQISEQKTQHDTEADAVSVTSALAYKSRLADNQSYKSTNEDKAYTVVSEKRSTVGDNDKKINFINKTKKNNMKDFILSTLSKNKVQGPFVVKKSGPQKAQPAFTVNQRGHLVAANTLEPITTKSLKSSSLAKQKSQMSTNGSNKQIQAQSKANDKQLEKKRLQAVEKVKHLKGQKKKEKNYNNKDLLQMVRMEEKEKEKKKQTQKDQNKNHSQKQNKAKVQQKSFEATKPIIQQTTVAFLDKLQAPQIEQQIKQLIQAQIDQNKTKEQPNAEQIVQQIRNQSVAQVKQKKPQLQSKTEKIASNSTTTIQQQVKLQQKIVYKSQTFSIANQQRKKENEEQVQIEHKGGKTQEIVFALKNQQNVKENEFKAEIEELKKIKEQLEKQKITIIEHQQYQTIRPKTEQKPLTQKNGDFGRIIDLSEQTKANQEKDEPPAQVINKKCYNQEYWIHIREQAESQIKRFKEEKELSELSKNNIKNNIDRSMSAKHEGEKQEEKSQEEQNEFNPSENQEKIQLNQEDILFDKRKKQLARMVNDHNKRVMPKRPPLPIISPQKPLHSLPAFNYLQIYPTFNHIFSVMYTKAEHQALQDIPMIMKDLTNMFTTHMQHFKDKNSYFKPAIFLPFDSANNLQLSDPKQLLLHAENTYVNLKKIVERLQIFNANLHGQFNEPDNRYYRVVKTKQQVYDIISTGFLRRKGWKELPHGCSLRSSWNLFWSWSKPDIDVSKLLVWQRINHFPFNKNLSRKDLLYKNLDSFRKMLKIPFNFLPLTFNLPKEFTQFSIKFHQEQIVNRDLNYWIMKPIGKSRGRGIKVINNLAQLNYTDNIIVQKYIINPLLLDGYKFDMRIYVLVTNFHPLQAFVYKEGFARLSTQKFSLQPMFIKNTFVHLTNFAINRNNQQAKQTAAFSGGSKISLKALKDKINKMGYSFNNIWSQVHQIIIKSLLGCSISVPPFPTAFQLFGYDIMIDTNQSCHLIQINASPSLQRSYLIDEIVKQSLIDDILDIVDPPNFNKEQLLDIMSERLLGKKKITPQEDLIAIARVLNYKPVRKLGEVPQNLGLFQMIAPSKLSTDLQRQIKGRSGANNPKNID